MTDPVFPPLSAAIRAELESWEDRALTPAEFNARVNAPWSEAERESFASLVTWFMRRYPTVGDRLHAQRLREARWRSNLIK